MIDNPPVNALSPGVPEGIGAAIVEMNSDDAIQAVVVIGAAELLSRARTSRTSQDDVGQPRRSLLPLLLRVEDSAKPVVMAIHGTRLEAAWNCYGGTLPGCVNYGAGGQPEVKLGIIPGALELSVCTTGGRRQSG